MNLKNLQIYLNKSAVQYKHINHISTQGHKIFHWGNLQTTKTPKALIAHLVNEMAQKKFFKKFLNSRSGIYHSHNENYQEKNQIDDLTTIFKRYKFFQCYTGTRPPGYGTRPPRPLRPRGSRASWETFPSVPKIRKLLETHKGHVPCSAARSNEGGLPDAPPPIF